MERTSSVDAGPTSRRSLPPVFWINIASKAALIGLLLFAVI